MRRLNLVTSTLLLLAAWRPQLANAQDPIVKEEMRKEVLEEGEQKKKQGWTVKMKIGASASLSDSRNVVGSENGSTVQIGGLLSAEATLVEQQHEWETLLEVQHGQTKTPQIEHFLKSNDSFDLKSTYSYRLLSPEWLGGFGRFRLNTQLLTGSIVRAEDTVVRRINLDGTDTVQRIPAQRRIVLTDPFEPLTLRETIGAFANPIEKKEIVIKAKLGIGAQHILVQDGFVLTDDAATPELELVQLQNVNELGGEFELRLDGALIEELLTWNAAANLFLPVVTSAETELSTGEQLNTELKLGLSLKLLKWLSLDYLFTAKRVPLVVNEWQVLNNVLLTAGFQIL